jgi:hypothetical protein
MQPLAGWERQWESFGVVKLNTLESAIKYIFNHTRAWLLVRLRQALPG